VQILFLEVEQHLHAGQFNARLVIQLHASVAVSEFGHWKARLAFELVSALLVLVSNFNPEERQFRHFQLEDSFLVPVGNPRILHRSRLPLGNIRRHSCNQHLQVKNNQANSPISLNLLEKISCRPCTRRKHKAGSIIPW
jgi:hypothetical protein